VPALNRNTLVPSADDVPPEPPLSRLSRPPSIEVVPEIVLAPESVTVPSPIYVLPAYVLLPLKTQLLLPKTFATPMKPASPPEITPLISAEPLPRKAILPSSAPALPPTDGSTTGPVIESLPLPGYRMR
jgi:hypothetical protein